MCRYNCVYNYYKYMLMPITVSLSVRSKQNKIYSDIIKIISHSQVMRRAKKKCKIGDSAKYQFPNP